MQCRGWYFTVQCEIALFLCGERQVCEVDGVCSQSGRWWYKIKKLVLHLLHAPRPHPGHLPHVCQRPEEGS
jgi:hypothetical protein